MRNGIAHVTVRNGLTLAYVIALTNAGLALLLAFGVHISEEQQVAIIGFVNAAVMVAARALQLPERTADGRTVQVTHVPVLATTPPVNPEPAEISTIVP